MLVTTRNSKIPLQKLFSAAFCFKTLLKVSQRGADSCTGKLTRYFSCHPSRQPACLKLPLKPTGSNTSAPLQRASRAEADPPRDGEQGRREPRKVSGGETSTAEGPGPVPPPRPADMDTAPARGTAHRTPPAPAAPRGTRTATAPTRSPSQVPGRQHQRRTSGRFHSNA